MELKAGYKLTEVGVIPEEWEVRPLADIAISGPKNGYSGRAGRDARGTPTLKLSATSSGRLVLDDESVKRLDETIDPRSDLFLRPGDLLIQRSNTFDLVGTAAIFDGPADTYVYPDLMMRLRFADDATAQWVCSFANSPKGRRYFLAIAAGSSGSMPKISGTSLRQMIIPFPSPSERRAIIAALGDVDALVTGLDELIAKKRGIKQAAMQQLLTGKQRLPGFRGEWEVKRLGEVAGIDVDNLTSDTPPSYAFKYISLEDVDTGSLRSYSEQRFASAPSRARRRLRAGDVLVSTVRPNLQSHLRFNSAEHDWVCSTGFSVVRAKNEEADPDYLFFHLFGHRVVKQIEALLTGSNYPAISGRDVKALEIPVPPLPEQRAIAAVLSDMDAEITALEQRREKTRALKQGMMQELLTGRTRLV